MSTEKKPSEETIGKAYDKIANAFHHKGGVNPYAYRLGFIDGWSSAIEEALQQVEKYNTGKELTPIVTAIINSIKQLKK